MRRFLLTATELLAAILLTGHFVSAAEAIAKEKTLFLIVDYLPAAVYAGDEIAVNVRVENTKNAVVQAELSLNAQRRSGEPLAQKILKTTSGHGTFGSASFSVASADVTSFSMILSVAGETAASLNVDVLHDDEAWPKTVVRAGVVEKEAVPGERIIWAPSRREKKVDRAFLPMKWLLGSDEKKDAKESTKKDLEGVVAFMPGGYCDPALRTEALGPYRLDGNAPILHAARAVLDTRGAATSLVVGLPPEDIEAATDPRLFRVVLDGLLTRLRSGGAQRVAILPPFKYGVSDERTNGFWKETADACATHQAQYVDPAPFLVEGNWRVDAAHPGAFAVRPNATGREQLGAFLKEFGVAARGK